VRKVEVMSSPESKACSRLILSPLRDRVFRRVPHVTFP